MGTRSLDRRPRARTVQLRITDRGVQAVTAGRKMVIELEDQRLAPLGGRQSDQSVKLRDTLLMLLRHIEHSDQMHTERRTDPRS